MSNQHLIKYNKKKHKTVLVIELRKTGIGNKSDAIVKVTENVQKIKNYLFFIK